MNLITLNTAAELVCFLAALVFLNRDSSAAWKLLIAYTFVTFATETTGLVMRRVLRMPNLPLYNGAVLIECCFVSFFLYTLFRQYGYQKKWLFAWYATFAAIYATELSLKHFSDFVSVSVVIMSIAFVMACLYYYYLKLTDDQYEPLLSSGQFWWVSGALFFYFGSTACNIFFDYLVNNEVSNYDSSVRYVIYNVLNVILYTLWSISFICRYRQRRSYRSLA